MGNISQSVIDEARSLNDAGQVQLAYQVLSSAGDNYSGRVADIVGESGGLFQGTVRSLWENQIPGSTQHFNTVAAQHQSNYFDILENNQGRIRLGTRFLVGTGKKRKSFAVADLIEHGGGVVGDDELVRMGDGDPMPFPWDFGETLPKPEDFVLACSGTTLEYIYKAAE
jgi:hypothetical protein